MASSHEMWVAPIPSPLSCDELKDLYTLPDALWAARFLPFQNLCLSELSADFRGRRGFVPTFSSAERPQGKEPGETRTTVIIFLFFVMVLGAH